MRKNIEKTLLQVIPLLQQSHYFVCNVYFTDLNATPRNHISFYLYMITL